MVPENLEAVGILYLYCSWYAPEYNMLPVMAGYPVHLFSSGVSWHVSVFSCLLGLVCLVFNLSDCTVISVGGVWFQSWSRFRSVGPSLRTGMVLLWYGFFLFTLGYRVAC